MSKWHYQLMYYTETNQYAIHEYYSLEDGDGWTESPITIVGDDVEDVKKMLQMMLDDIDKHGVKDYEYKQVKRV